MTFCNTNIASYVGAKMGKLAQHVGERQRANELEKVGSETMGTFVSSEACFPEIASINFKKKVMTAPSSCWRGLLSAMWANFSKTKPHNT